jgi:hypothetical protein
MYSIIDELGGVASIKEIIALTRTRAPKMYVNKLLHSDLRRLRNWGYVSYDAMKRVYTIVEPFPEANIYHTTITKEDEVIEE